MLKRDKDQIYAKWLIGDKMDMNPHIVHLLILSISDLSLPEKPTLTVDIFWTIAKDILGK